MNGFQANVAPSEAAGLPAACLAKRLACAGVGRAAKRCARRRGSRCKALRWHGCWLRRQVPCRRRLHNPQRLAQAAERHVEIRGARSTRARRTLRLPGRGLRRQVPCRRRRHNPQRLQSGRQGHAAKRGVANDVVCKAACAWRVPPPSRGRSPLLPVCKSYQQRKKGPARLLVLLACTPPQPGQAPAITRMQKLSAAQEATYKKSFCAACTPPHLGQVPAITRMQKLSTVHKPTPTWKRCTV